MCVCLCVSIYIYEDFDLFKFWFWFDQSYVTTKISVKHKFSFKQGNKSEKKVIAIDHSDETRVFRRHQLVATVTGVIKTVKKREAEGNTTRHWISKTRERRRWIRDYLCAKPCKELPSKKRGKGRKGEGRVGFRKT